MDRGVIPVNWRARREASYAQLMTAAHTRAVLIRLDDGNALCARPDSHFTRGGWGRGLIGIVCYVLLHPEWFGEDRAGSTGQDRGSRYGSLNVCAETVTLLPGGREEDTFSRWLRPEPWGRGGRAENIGTGSRW